MPQCSLRMFASTSATTFPDARNSWTASMLVQPAGPPSHPPWPQVDFVRDRCVDVAPEGGASRATRASSVSRFPPGSGYRVDRTGCTPTEAQR
jgi:hypothetical protein